MIPPRGALTTTKRREPMILSPLLLILLSFSLAWMVHLISLSPLLILYFKEKFLAISLYLSLPPPPRSSPPTPLPEKLWHPSSSLCQASSSSLFIAPPSSSSSLSLAHFIFSLCAHLSFFLHHRASLSLLGALLYLYGILLSLSLKTIVVLFTACSLSEIHPPLSFPIVLSPMNTVPQIIAEANRPPHLSLSLSQECHQNFL